MTEEQKLKVTSYSQLPVQDAFKGDHQKGEIELCLPVDDVLPVVYSDKYIQLVEDQVKFPNTRQGKYLRAFTKTETSGEHGVVALTRYNHQVVLIRLFRHPTRSWELELPRGFADSGYSPEENIVREVREELGVDTQQILPLGIVCPNTGLLASRIHCFDVTLSEMPDEKFSNPGEAIDGLVIATKSELMQLIASGEIRDGFSLSVIMLAMAKGLI